MISLWQNCKVETFSTYSRENMSFELLYFHILLYFKNIMLQQSKTLIFEPHLPETPFIRTIWFWWNIQPGHFLRLIFNTIAVVSTKFSVHFIAKLNRHFSTNTLFLRYYTLNHSKMSHLKQQSCAPGMCQNGRKSLHLFWNFCQESGVSVGSISHM